MWIEKNDRGEITATFFVKGKPIRLNSATVNEFLQQPTGGFKITSCRNMTMNNFEKLKEKKLEYVNRQGGVNEMSLCNRKLGSIMAQFIQCREAKDLTLSNYIMLYHTGRAELIDLRDVFWHNLEMTETHLRRGLPCGLVLKFIIEALGIDHDGEEVVGPTTYFKKKILSGIKWQRERAGIDAETGA
ncbi:hypothetical protein M9H77_09298 [Catharanthus roseus]|uniref:Uncharacterized protein n=1 Tax=Catharanthus roseus TaxID=4058 RepID=A0ACC0C0L7_CATRO|nr:hypothetical protein M9H77_09298 [Catharanthus roseus]